MSIEHAKFLGISSAWYASVFLELDFMLGSIEL